MKPFGNMMKAIARRLRREDNPYAEIDEKTWETIDILNKYVEECHKYTAFCNGEYPEKVDTPSLVLKNVYAEGVDFSHIKTYGYLNFSGSTFKNCDFSALKFFSADVSMAYFEKCIFECVDMSNANMSGSCFCDCDFSGVDFFNVNMTAADFDGSDFSGTDMSQARMCGTNLSGVSGLLSAAEFMNTKFKRCAEGYVVYKAVGRGTPYRNHAEAAWGEITPGKTVRETCNPIRTNDCGCGVNFATLIWCMQNYPSADIWECVIPYDQAASIVVPYNTDGKARCETLKFVRMLTGKDACGLLAGRDEYIL